MSDRYTSCDLMAGAPGTCRHCGNPLTGLRRTWCSEECSQVYTDNHLWTAARRSAVWRDGRRCCRCGRSPDDLVAIAGLLAVYGSPLGVRVGRDSSLGRATIGIIFRELCPNPEGFWLFADLQEAVQSSDLEVNHIEPRRGGGYRAGCWNHLDNLETLCHDCHADETARQQGHRRRADAHPVVWIREGT